jgi:hypothetical protein
VAPFPSPLHRGLLFGGLATALLVLGGCGRKAEPLVPVRGKLTVKGQPLFAGTVVFYPDRENGNLTAGEPRGFIEQGIYELYSDDAEGAPPGRYKVAMFAVKGAWPTAPRDRRSG